MVGGALTKDDSTCFAVGYLVHEAERERERERDGIGTIVVSP